MSKLEVKFLCLITLLSLILVTQAEMSKKWSSDESSETNALKETKLYLKQIQNLLREKYYDELNNDGYDSNIHSAESKRFIEFKRDLSGKLQRRKRSNL